MNPAIDLLIDILENAIITFYLVKSSSMNSKYKPWKAIAACIIAAVSCFVMNHLIYYEGFLILFYVFFYFSFLKLYASDPWYLDLLNAVIPFVCIYVINLPLVYLVQEYILRVYYPDLSYTDILPVLSLITKALLAAALYLVTVWKRRISHKPDRKTALAITAVFILLFSAVIIIGYILFTRTDNVLFYALMVTCMVIILAVSAFSITEKLLKQQAEKQQLESENQMIRAQLKDQKKLMEYSRQISQERHNLKHVLKTVEAELTENGNEKALCIIRRELDQIESIHQIARTGNAVLDIFLSDLSMQAEKNGIDFTCEISEASSIPLTDDDLGLLLGNLFDNAIENCSQDPKRIRVVMHRQNHFYYIEARNSTSAEDGENPSVLTKKKENGHGYGIQTIRNICARYNGSLNYYIKDHLFCFVILLPDHH